VDNQLLPFLGDHHNYFEHVPGMIRPDYESPVGLIAGILDRKEVLNRMDDFCLDDSVTACRWEKLHIQYCTTISERSGWQSRQTSRLK
jgi:hypothetical protein